MRQSVFIAVALFLACCIPRGYCAGPDYKQVLITANSNSVQVRLPLTDAAGKVRVKEQAVTGYGQPVAPTKTALGTKHYLEWQIGYDRPDTNSPSAVPEIHFMRNGQCKFGHELSKIILEAVRVGILATNDLLRELNSLQKIRPAEFEENQPMRVESTTNRTAGGFQMVVERLPQLVKTTPHGWVQIQLKPKQHAVGYQAMVYVCLPLGEVLDASGHPRLAGPAQSKETVCYVFNRANADLLLTVIDAFGIASQEHNQDMRDILGCILKVAN